MNYYSVTKDTIRYLFNINITYFKKVKVGDNVAVLYYYNDKSKRLNKTLYNFEINKIFYTEEFVKTNLQNGKDFLNEVKSLGVSSFVETYTLKLVFKDLDFKGLDTNIIGFNYDPVNKDQTGYVVYNDVFKTRQLLKATYGDIIKTKKAINHINIDDGSLIKFLLETKQL